MTLPPIEQQDLDQTGRPGDDTAQRDASGSPTSRTTGTRAHRGVPALPEVTRRARSQPQVEVELPVSRDAKHLRPGPRDEQHQGDFERGRTEVRDRGNALGAQASSPPSDNVPVHLATERSDSGTETVSTPPVLCDHGEQVSRPDTSKDLLRRERASVCSRTTVRRNEPCQEPTRHLDADAAESSARRKGSDEERGLPRTSAIVSSGTTSSPCMRCRTSLPVTADHNITSLSYSPAVTKKQTKKRKRKKRPDCGTASTWLRLEQTKSSTLSISEQHSGIGNVDCTRCKMCQFPRTIEMDPSKKNISSLLHRQQREATLESLRICKLHVHIVGVEGSRLSKADSSKAFTCRLKGLCSVIHVHDHLCLTSYSDLDLARHSSCF